MSNCTRRCLQNTAVHALRDARALLERAAAIAAGSTAASTCDVGCTLRPGEAATATEPSVLVKDFTAARLVTLNRPKSLNATDLGMQCLLRRYLMEAPHAQDAGNRAWARACAAARSCDRPCGDDIRYGHLSDAVENTNMDGSGDGDRKGCVYILQGAGSRSFCAGGDVVAMVRDEPAGTQLAVSYLEYQLDYYLWCAAHREHAKPYCNSSADGGRCDDHVRRPRNIYVSLMNGYVMGGGVGLSLHSDIRVAAPNTVFAMPECTIGFFPDVGASYFLPRLDFPSEFHATAGTPGLGLYVGLTAARVNGTDLLHTGIATHFLPDAAAFPALADALCAVRKPNEVRDVLASLGAIEASSASSISTPPPVTLDSVRRDVLARCFTLSPNAARAYAADRSGSTKTKTSRAGGGHRCPESHGTRSLEAVSPVTSVEDAVRRVEREAAHGATAAHRAFADELMEQLAAAANGCDSAPAFSMPTHASASGSRAREQEGNRHAHHRQQQHQEQKRAQRRSPPPLSPTSMKLTFDMQARGLAMDDLAPALAQEYAACLHACDAEVGSDFFTGVHAALIDKERTSAPAWRPARLADVDAARVEAFYTPKRRRGVQQPIWDPFTPFEELSLW